MPLTTHAFSLLPKCTGSTGTANVNGVDDSQSCGVNDFEELIVNVSKFILGISGAVALGFFVYGGFTWIISGGSPDKVKSGMTTLKNATIGLLVIFISYTLVFNIVKIIGGTTGAGLKIESSPGGG
ncbi:MAG: pilin [Candidatus Falkowbacteria bacterium]|nr:pilin [Candidatus Falkowbacteria bacterium]